MAVTESWSQVISKLRRENEELTAEKARWDQEKAALRREVEELRQKLEEAQGRIDELERTVARQAAPFRPAVRGAPRASAPEPGELYG